MKLLLVVALIAGCHSEPPAACIAFADKEWSCHPQSARKSNSTDDRFCASAFESEIPEHGVERAFMLRYRHDAICAESSATCDAYEHCRDTFDIAAAVRP